MWSKFGKSSQSWTVHIVLYLIQNVILFKQYIKLLLIVFQQVFKCQSLPEGEVSRGVLVDANIQPVRGDSSVLGLTSV
jgi:hypothetical protein